jgi:primosomal protein N' (replication factor Y)
MIAKVVVDVAVDREFDYRVPAALAATVKIGSRVNVSFGPRHTQGYVVGLVDSSERAELKPVESVVGAKPYIDETMLKLARWMAEYYCAPVEMAIQAVLPGAVRQKKAHFKEQWFVRLLPADARGVDRGDCAAAELSQPASARPVAEEGLVGTAVAAGVDRGAVAALRAKAPQQAAALEALSAPGVAGMFLHDLVRCTGADQAAVRALAKKGFVVIEKQAVLRNPLLEHHVLPTPPLSLMPQQAAALATVKQSIETCQPPVVLLHGVTGSGKTEVYLQAIAHALERGQGAIVLVPEIALTPQTIERFRGRFGDTIAVLHSALSDGERHDEWHRLWEGSARIAVGARSAVFAPVHRLGLIVVDEEHEQTYKQDEAPRYHARDVAVMRGAMEGCAVLLGSATPALESFHNARRGKYRLVALPHRVDHRTMPVMRIVDMRVEAERTGKVSVFSRDLVEAIRRRLERAEQVMLFLNRRGFATSLGCPKCGFVAQCDQCSVAYTYHRVDEVLKCHICGSRKAVPARCPGCQDPDYRLGGIGTQRVEAIVTKVFPGARVARMDADTTAAKDSHRRILGEFKAGKVDILVGTQMIAKGLHFPNVTLIGVLNADLSLHVPDFRAGERTFQLLTQVAGRAGRGDVAGEVIVQTFTPFHPTIQAARRLDYEGFCDQELEFRKELSYPPFAHLVCVGFRGEQEPRVAAAAAALAERLRAALPGDVVMTEPCASPLARAKGKYRYQLLLRAARTRAITHPLKTALREVKWPPGVAFSVDVDAVALT